MSSIDRDWQSSDLTKLYLNNLRGAIPLAAEQLDVMLRILSTGQPVRKFLDLGCGDGVLGLTILGAHPHAHGVFADFSPSMLEACRSKLQAQGIAGTILEIDYSTPAWATAAGPHGPFDAVVSGFSIHHQPDERKRAIYREIHDLLTPGGWFIHLEHCAAASRTAHRLFEEKFIDNIFALLAREGRNADREQIRREFIDRVDKQANMLAPAEKQCEWLREIGYQDVDCFLKFHELAVFGGRRVG